MSKLTESARHEDCIRCGAPNPYACHYNGIRQHSLGKGRGIKANDLATAEFCYQCDKLFTEGNNKAFKSIEDRSEQFLFWIMMTNIRRLNKGVLKV